MITTASVVDVEDMQVLEVGPSLFEPVPELTTRTGALVARAVVNVSNGSIPVQLMSVGEPIHLRKETVLGHVRHLTHSVAAVGALGADVPSTCRTKKATDPVTRDHLLSLFDFSATPLSSADLQQLQTLVYQHRRVFSLHSTDVGHTTAVYHSIPTCDARPRKQPLRRLPRALRPVVDEQLNTMLRADGIQSYSSPRPFPIVLIKKKDGNHRFCVDYRALNSLTVKDSYPLSRIDETLDSLSGSQFFSTLDLASGYWKVSVSPEDRSKTAFSTTRGLYEFKSMPFGLANAPSTSQRLMESTLAGLQWEDCLIYLDDIIVFSATSSQHLQRLSKVFCRLQNSGLKLKPTKCHFCCSSVSYLGHVVFADSVGSDTTKIEVVQNFPIPRNSLELKHFLSLAGYYRRSIQGFSQIASPSLHCFKRGTPITGPPLALKLSLLSRTN